ncbi:hypothetical protein [Hymenobacter rigui]|uniref:hypothetical protein n=1 Tax=Hymenobacter rigui TaxID=334424 RepID=UPI0011CFFBDD|nr:hypothetical protein [Hymenobacter rigui]
MAFQFGGNNPGAGYGSSNQHIEIKPHIPTVELSTLYVLLPQHFAVVALGPGKSLEQSRARLGATLGSNGYEWEAVVEYARNVYEHKKGKLRGVNSEAEFLAEFEKVRPHHLAAFLASK